MSNGGSSIHLDPDVLNALLAQYVNRPGGPHVTFQDGRFVARVGGVTVWVDRVSIGADGLDVNLGARRRQA